MNRDLPKASRANRNIGASYIEAIVALIFITIVLGAVAPLFIGQRQNNVDSEMRTSAAALAQATLEDYRLRFRDTLPPLTSAAGVDQTQTSMGNQFTVNLRVHEFDGVDASGNLNCGPTANPTSSARCIRIQVSKGGTLVYVIETVYTQI
jgi:type II secretory pathway pseudopilin PulG